MHLLILFSSLALILSTSCLKQAWQDLPPLFLGVSGFLLSFLHPSHTQSLLLPQPFSKSMFLSLASLNDIMFIIKSEINYNKLFWPSISMVAFQSRSEFEVWMATMAAAQCSDSGQLGSLVWHWKSWHVTISVCPFACSLVLLWLCQDGRILSRAAGAHGVSAAVPRHAGDDGTALVVTQRWPGLQERCTLWLSAYVCLCGLVLCATSSSKINGLNSSPKWCSQEWLLDKR